MSIEIELKCKIDDTETVLQSLVDGGMTPEQLADFIFGDDHWSMNGLSI